MPTINDSTVVSSSYFPSNSGKPLMLSNGWLIVGVAEKINGTVNTPLGGDPVYPSYPLANNIFFYKSIDNGATWILLTTGYDSYFGGEFALTSVGTKIYCMFRMNQTISTISFDATTVGASLTLNYSSSGSHLAVLVDNDMTSPDLTGIAITTNASGTEIHATYSAKCTLRTNSYNIYYRKGTISGLTITWGTRERWTSYDSASYGFTFPVIVVKSNNVPVVVCQGMTGHNVVAMTNDGTFQYPSDGSMSVSYTYAGSGNQYGQFQKAVDAIIDSTGAIHVVWQGYGHSFNPDNQTFNIKYSKSTDGGYSWTEVQLTTGIGIYQVKPSITVNKSNEIFVVYEGATTTSNNLSDFRIRMLKYSGSSWGSVVQLLNPETHIPCTLKNTNLNFTSPLFIFRGVTTAKIGFCGTWITVNMKTKIDGVLKEYSDGWVKIDGVLRKIESIKIKIDGVLRSQ